jgi:hypothetical protein
MRTPSRRVGGRAGERGRGLWLAVCVLGNAGALAAQPINLLENPDFLEVQLTDGWSLASPGELDFTSIDRHGCPGSGAGQLTSGPTDAGSQYGLAGQCRLIDPATWTHGAHAAFDYNSASAESVYSFLFYYPDTTCGMTLGLLDSHYAFGEVGPGWHRVIHDDLAIPPTAQSVRVGFGAEKGGETPFETLIDRAWFGQASPIFDDSFEPGTTCRWITVPPP